MPIDPTGKKKSTANEKWNINKQNRKENMENAKEKNRLRDKEIQRRM